MPNNEKYEHSLPIGFVLKVGNREYIVEDVLGQGGFGITYKVKSRVSVGNISIDANFAVKEFFPDFCWRADDSATVQVPPTKKNETLDGLEDFIVEGERLQQVCKLNPNIVNVNEVFRANGTAYYVMEYLSGGDLRKLIKENGGGFSEATMMSILLPVASALQSVHNSMMLHLDIKPDNIVMRQSNDGTPDVPVLIDFGIAVHFKKDGSPTTKHPSKGLTPGFSPTEQYEGIKRFDPRLDIYALSATCYYMLTGQEPKSAFEMNAADVYNELSGRASERTVKAIVQGLSKDAAARPANISQFLKLFKETNALPVGAAVNGKYQKYMIVGVMEETESFIHYKATTACDTQKTSAQGTKRTIYDLWEYFVPGSHTRQQSGEVEATKEEITANWNLPSKLAGYNIADYGTTTSQNGTLDTEYFFNGTEYVAIRKGYKPTPAWVKSLSQMWKKTKKPLLIAVGALAVMAAAGWLVYTLIENSKQKGPEKQEEMIEESTPELNIEGEASSISEEPKAAAEEPQTSTVQKEPEKKEVDKKEAEKKEQPKTNEKKEEPKIKYSEGKNTEPPKDTRTDDQIVQDAFNRGDMETVKAYAKKGNKKAKILCSE